MNRSSELNSSEAIPAGLVGDSCEGLAYLDGVQCKCLIDTGSQVTCLSESFYRQNLGHRELYSVNDLLHIEGAAGQVVPYLGYIEVELRFPKNMCGTGSKFNVLVLICPDQPYNSNMPFLVGMNVLKNLVRDCQEKSGGKDSYKYTQSGQWPIQVILRGKAVVKVMLNQCKSGFNLNHLLLLPAMK